MGAAGSPRTASSRTSTMSCPSGTSDSTPDIASFTVKADRRGARRGRAPRARRRCGCPPCRGSCRMSRTGTPSSNGTCPGGAASIRRPRVRLLQHRHERGDTDASSKEAVAGGCRQREAIALQRPRNPRFLRRARTLTVQFAVDSVRAPKCVTPSEPFGPNGRRGLRDALLPALPPRPLGTSPFTESHPCAMPAAPFHPVLE